MSVGRKRKLTDDETFQVNVRIIIGVGGVGGGSVGSNGKDSSQR